MDTQLDTAGANALVVATAIRNFAWYFPRIPELRRLADVVDGLSAEDLDTIQQHTHETPVQRSRRADLLALIAPVAAASWERNHPDLPGANAVLDAALALVGRKALPWGSLFWQSYYKMTAPVAMIRELRWLHADRTVTDISPWD